ncbi:tRNA glutamyl-Q(34) synthetase GluQRS [Collinsella vaginalis]|uniref:tRNA glutamyl-Q(34) synthetase GluQRS n=1 Tax=Collinsella vaginalis TaxID=1870987 RepID=UPI000A26AD43
MGGGPESPAAAVAPGRPSSTTVEPAGAAPVGRFAPSPTGRMHLGNVYAALLAWLSVRSRGGRVLMRIEDLDPRAMSGPWAPLILDDLNWLGLTWDGDPVYQHDRLGLYEDAANRLRDFGLVYPCFCSRAELHAASAPHASDGSPIYPGTCRDLSPEEVSARSRVRPPAWRLRVPDAADPAGTFAFTDLVFGSQCQHLATTCGDFLIRRSDGVFAYQLAVVVDDAAMGVTEVVRGHDLMGSVPRQLYLQHLLGLPHPVYAHVPLLLAPDGRRLSKRDQDLDIGELRARFGDAAHLLGWLAALTGLSEDAAPITAEQLATSFDWERVRRHRADVVISR